MPTLTLVFKKDLFQVCFLIACLTSSCDHKTFSYASLFVSSISFQAKKQSKAKEKQAQGLSNGTLQ